MNSPNLKVIILCGGLGTRLREETEYRPKPMVPIGGKPILWHIMKTYARHGHKDFILCLGYKGDVIKDYFRNYLWHNSSVSMRLGRGGEIKFLDEHDEVDWNVTLLETGMNTMTGGRLARALKHVGENEDFLFTYGDGLINSDINASIAFHRAHGQLATVTAVRPSGRFGELSIEDTTITGFHEKPEFEHGYINGGYFVLNSAVAKYLGDDTCVFEKEPLEKLTQEGHLKAYCHDSFWQCMDTYREFEMLNGMWDKGNAPWKVW